MSYVQRSLIEFRADRSIDMPAYQKKFQKIEAGLGPFDSQYRYSRSVGEKMHISNSRYFPVILEYTVLVPDSKTKLSKIEGTQFCSRIRVQATVVLRFWGVFDPRLVPCVSVLYDSSSSLRTKKVLSLESYMETTTQFGRRTRTKLVWSVLVLLRDSSSSLRTKKVLSLQSYMETTTQFGRRTRTKLVWSVLVLPAALFFQISRVVGTDHTKSVLQILERRGQKHPKIGELLYSR
jgi:hypothetical protein